MRPVIGYTIFFTGEKMISVFPPFGAASQSGNVSQLSLLPLNRSWFQGLQTLFQSNNLSKTQQNVALLKEFLTLKNESRLLEEIPPKELTAYISEFIILRYERTTTTKTMNHESNSLRSLMASFERYLKKKNSTFLLKALINRQP